MTSTGENNKFSVVKIVQELLQEEPNKAAITPSLIAEKIKLVVTMNPKWGTELDWDAVTDELIRRFSVWRGQDMSLVSNEGHVPWLSPERKKDWRYWRRYREWQEDRLPWIAVDGLDTSSDSILGKLEDPLREGPWDRRGLVVGHVQSGKTGNYTGLICKAADAGYKIIIVLAGMHNNLRSQTQMRLDEGFLGYETNPLPDDIRIIGVGEIDPDPAIRPNYATNRSDKGDFSTKIAKSLGISPEQRPWLFVVKKNKSVLLHLYNWIINHVANTTDAATGRKIVAHLPLLIIDDEADHGSVDTGEQLFTEDGKPDEEHQPTAINGLIRQILHAFNRKSYVGYTATPFANIFIHERGETPAKGPDLFPAAFIHNLGAPSNYVGPARVFGLNTGEKREGSLPLVRGIDDHCSEDGAAGWMPVKHRTTHKPVHTSAHGMPPSLAEAIDAFILACAARQLRGQNHQHSSMLIHVTRFNAVQNEVHEQVETYVRHIDQRLSRGIGKEETVSRLEDLWVRDFQTTTSAMRKAIPDTSYEPVFTWKDIAGVLPDVVGEISVRMINGTAKDALDYADSADGLKVIAIGGDKLARGLTLEGLCVSYFLRASRMYDTLMQMGRWFGYRPSYLDLCRLYTTTDLVEWFEHIADASEELREEFDMMVDSGGTPRDYGLKVISHPVLMVTSHLKMRSARSLFLSFSGHVVETVSMHKDSLTVRANLRSFERLVSAMGKPHKIPERQRNGAIDRWNGVYWENISPKDIAEFLGGYKTHPAAPKANSLFLKEFIESMAKTGELTKWSVAVIGGSVDEHPWLFEGEYSVQRSQRTGSTTVGGSESSDRYAIGRLLSPKDEGIDLDEAAWTAALAETRRIWHADPGRLRNKTEPEVPNGPALRRIRGFGDGTIAPHSERGVLLIYLLDPKAAGITTAAGEDPIVAFGISFPGSSSGTKIEYKVNNVLWEQEYGAGD
jgi:hypothetical protein